ncbi:MAG: AAA family ATPase, partial [Bacteroidia bacterium]|nr:AAA family ATPase [Bacteroidia bacterium]
MINNASEFYQVIKNKFPFTPTLKQDKVLKELSLFIFDDTPNSLYLLKGYAGTGKTSIIGAIVSQLWQVKKSAILLAPTGRAAKVISSYSNKEAFTIHKKIYFPKKEKSGGVKFVMQPNKHRNT